MPDLEQRIAIWRSQMIDAGIKTPVPLDELEAHLREEIAAKHLIARKLGKRTLITMADLEA